MEASDVNSDDGDVPLDSSLEENEETLQNTRAMSDNHISEGLF